jgi:hypothetical protein
LCERSNSPISVEDNKPEYEKRAPDSESRFTMDSLKSPTDFQAPSISPSESQKFKEFFQACMDEEQEDIDESECSSNAFSSGQTFWMNLLEQKEGESQTTAESRQIDSPFGREIHRSWSVGSSLSGLSPKNGLSPHSVGNTSEDSDASRRNAVISALFKSPDATPNFHRSSTGDRSILASPQTKQSQAKPVSSQSQPTTKLNSNPEFSFHSPKQQAHKLTTPREFGGDVTNISNTSATPIIASSIPRPFYQQQSQQRVPEFIESRGMKEEARSLSTSSSKTAALHHGDRRTAEHCTVLPNSTIECNSELPQFSTNDSESASQFISAYENKWRKASPKADLMIEIRIPGISSPDSATESVYGKMQIEKISPKAEHQDRFQWAYERWYQAGLMKKMHVKREISPRVVKGISRFRTAASTASSFPVQSAPNKAPKIKEQSLAKYIASTSASITNVPSLDIDPVPSTESGDTYQYIASTSASITNAHSFDTGDTTQGSFRDLLNIWRQQSDDKPNTHFLSPQPYSVELETSADTPQRLGKLESPSRSTNRGDERPDVVTSAAKTEEPPIKEIPLVTKRIKEFDRDYFDRVREDHTTSPGGEIPRSQSNDQEGRDQSVTSVVESTPSSDEGENEYTSPFKNLQGVADSDLYEKDGLFAVREATRALVIPEDKETFEVMVGDTKTDEGHDLVIRNLAHFSPNHGTAPSGYVPCQCTGSVFSGNDDFLSFFLPQMGTACICGKQNKGLVNPDVPTGIENVLRPWQVKFLKSFGIHRGEQLVKARHRSGDMMAKALRQWRKKHGMTPFKTSCCGMAIHIWAKTCKTYVRSIRKQVAAGNQLLERQPCIALSEMSNFLKDLPDAPKRRADPLHLDIEPGSQVEV